MRRGEGRGSERGGRGGGGEEAEEEEGKEEEEGRSGRGCRQLSRCFASGILLPRSARFPASAASSSAFSSPVCVLASSSVSTWPPGQNAFHSRARARGRAPAAEEHEEQTRKEGGRGRTPRGASLKIPASPHDASAWRA